MNDPTQSPPQRLPQTNPHGTAAPRPVISPAGGTGPSGFHVAALQPAPAKAAISSSTKRQLRTLGLLSGESSVGFGISAAL